MTLASGQSKPLLHRFLAYHFDRPYEDVSNSQTPSTAAEACQSCPVMNELRCLKISSDALHILNLVPIIHVVWADAPPRSDQVQNVLNNAQEEGIRPGMVAWKLLELWLKARPDSSLFSVWSDYVAALSWPMDPQRFAELKQWSLQRAETTADSMQMGFGLLQTKRQHDFAVQQIANAFDV